MQIDTVTTDSGVTVRVRTTDGWTTNLGFGLRTSGTQHVINAFVQEINLLGTRTIATLGYQNDPDRTTVLVGFDTPRLIANRVGIGASYSRRSDGHSAGAALNYPFVSLSSRQGGSLSWGLFDGRVLHYEGGTRFARTRRDGSSRSCAPTARWRFARARAATCASGFTGRCVATISARREAPRSFRARSRWRPDRTSPLRAPRYIQVRNYEAMGRVEDVDLGPTVRADVAIAPRAWGYERNGVGGRLAASAGLRVPAGFAQLGASVGGLHSSAGVDSSSADASLLAVMQPNDRHLLVGERRGGAAQQSAVRRRVRPRPRLRGAGVPVACVHGRPVLPAER